MTPPQGGDFGKSLLSSPWNGEGDREAVEGLWDTPPNEKRSILSDAPFNLPALVKSYWMRVQVWFEQSGSRTQPRRRSVLSFGMVMVPR
jgi:hypothetical protein